MRITNDKGVVTRYHAVYVPEFVCTLISMGTLLEEGAVCQSDSGDIDLYLDGSHFLSATVESSVLRMKTASSDLVPVAAANLMATAASPTRPDFNIWHQRYGHQHDAAIVQGLG